MIISLFLFLSFFCHSTLPRLFTIVVSEPSALDKPDGISRSSAHLARQHLLSVLELNRTQVDFQHTDQQSNIAKLLCFVFYELENSVEKYLHWLINIVILIYIIDQSNQF
jgi:hypothetical protein